MPACIATQTAWWQACAAARDISRMPAADLVPSPRRRGGVLRYVGFAAAAIVFLVAASTVPMVLRNWLQQQQEQSSILRSTATNSRMKSLLLEVSPVPARVSAERCNCRPEPAWG